MNGHAFRVRYTDSDLLCREVSAGAGSAFAEVERNSNDHR